MIGFFHWQFSRGPNWRFIHSIWGWRTPEEFLRFAPLPHTEVVSMPDLYREVFMMPKYKRRHPPHRCWYFIFRSECALCGAPKDYRERRYTRKPKNPAKRYEYGAPWACDDHFM